MIRGLKSLPRDGESARPMGEMGGRCEEADDTTEDALEGPRRGLEEESGTIPVLSISWATDVSVACQLVCSSSFIGALSGNRGKTWCMSLLATREKGRNIPINSCTCVSPTSCTFERRSS